MIALNDDGFPYVVPLNFGTAVEDGQLYLYFHCAGEGKKLELIRRDNRATFEMNCGHNFILYEERMSCTMGYASVIGHGVIEFVPEADKLEALKRLMGQYHAEDFQFNTKMAGVTTVLRLKVLDMSTAIYQVIFEDLRKKIFSGEVNPGEMLPSESELAKQYNASRVTIRKSLEMLEREKIIRSWHGKGYFVLTPEHERFTLIYDECVDQYESKIQNIQLVEPDEELLHGKHSFRSLRPVIPNELTQRQHIFRVRVIAVGDHLILSENKAAVAQFIAEEFKTVNALFFCAGTQQAGAHSSDHAAIGKRLSHFKDVVLLYLNRNMALRIVLEVVCEPDERAFHKQLDGLVLSDDLVQDSFERRPVEHFPLAPVHDHAVTFQNNVFFYPERENTC